ncbi:MAG: LruC domain-containing protein [Bacteroidota bacterium]
MKKLFAITALISLLTASGIMAQVTLNCESGNRAIEQGNCWGFGATSYSNTANLVITGSWSTKSNSLTNMSPTACWIKTPWMLVGDGNITFQSRLDGAGNGVTAKGIALSYIPYVVGASYGEGTPVQFFTYNFPVFNVTTIRDIVAPIPAAILNSATAFKIMVSFIGTGGNERAYSDNFIFPGTYWSDPANGCIPMVLIQDADGDGVADASDAYPTDPNRAYNSYFPSATQSGTLAFEDLWPAKGDFDFNDVVVDYRMQTVTNAANNVVEVFANFVLRASGASFHNGFGFQLDGIAPNKIISVTGNHISPSPANEHIAYNMESNGLENGQTYATCIVADCFRRVMSQGLDPASPTIKFINTDPAEAVVPNYPMTVHLVFINNGIPAPGGTVSISEFPSSVFNFFIVAETWTGEMHGDARVTIQDRGKEIHLADRIPTSKVNPLLFGTLDDDSGSGKYYKTANNLPWGINIIQGFSYPVEKAPINEAYLHFIDWASSEGIDYPDWFSNTASGYRNPAKIY